MNVLVISDIHINNGGKLGVFGWKLKKFIKKIEKIRRKYSIKKIILNGDIYDLYQHSFEDIAENNKKIIDYFKDPIFVYIKGNHDARVEFGLDSYQIQNSKGKIIHFEHGHNADFLNGTRIGRFIGKIGFTFLKIILRNKFLLNFYFRYIEHNDQINRIPKKYDSYKYLKYALGLLRLYDVVIMGHTHKLETHKTYYMHKKKRYLNSGSCTLGRFQGIILNTETLKFKIIKYNNRKENEKQKEDNIKDKLKFLSSKTILDTENQIIQNELVEGNIPVSQNKEDSSMNKSLKTRLTEYSLNIF